MRFKLRPIYSMWLLIAIAMVIFIGISFTDINIGSYTLSKANFKEVLINKDKEDVLISQDTLQDIRDTIQIELPRELEPDTTVHSVLVFGDSMTHHLAMSIAKYGTKNNYKVMGVTWESSSIPGWSGSGKIGQFIERSKPDFIIISLGSNEIGLKHFDQRIPYIKKVVEQLDDIPFIWVGPPLWKEDTGVYPMLEKAIPEELIFKTESLDIPRGPDHIHPTKQGADIWADTLMRWIRKSPHPILTEVPDSGTTTKGHKFIYLHPDD